MAVDQVGQHLLQGRVVVVVLLELHQAGHQRAPFALGHAQAEQQQDRVGFGLFHDDAAA
ncbi:hypothetical protein D3C81_1631580 [compost metagenome]